MDINADFGESFGNWRMGDEAIIEQLTTVSLACGFHAGDPVTMLRCSRLAAEQAVAVGAHPGLPDLMGFGRRIMNISLEDAYAYAAYQIGAVAAFLRPLGMTVNHVKPHGALYPMVQRDRKLAEAIVAAMADVCPEAMLFWPAPTENAPLANAARDRGIRVVGEIYPDMTYDAEGSLILERAKTSMSPDAAAASVRRFLDDGCIMAVDGTLVPVTAESICIHGDTPNAAEVVHAVRSTLIERDIVIGRVATDA